MSEIIHPGGGVLYMKIGIHAEEPLEKIIARKRKEIEDEGFGMWGYGGNTCHPKTMVQPFARMFEERGEEIYLCMEEMDSKHYAERLRADQYSADGETWQDVRPRINVIGSRFALVIKSLETVELELALAQTQVAVGPSQGRAGDRYIQGRVDKACLEVIQPVQGTNLPEGTTKPIKLVAEIIKPYAVFLRTRS